MRRVSATVLRPRVALEKAAPRTHRNEAHGWFTLGMLFEQGASQSVASRAQLHVASKTYPIVRSAFGEVVMVFLDHVIMAQMQRTSLSITKCEVAYMPPALSTRRIILQSDSRITANGPVKTFRCGRIKAAVWVHEVDKRKFYNVTFARTYVDEQNNSTIPTVSAATIFPWSPSWRTRRTRSSSNDEL